MMYAKASKLLLPVVAIVLPMLPWVATAHAETKTAHALKAGTPVVSGGSYGSTLDLSLTSNALSPSRSGARTLRGPLSAPSNALIHCNKSYSFSDSNGTYTIQHACYGSTAPWGFRIKSTLCAIATSAVSETGMSWTRNGVTQPTQALHPGYPCDYTFHGTYNPARGNDRLTYSDHFTFSIPNGHADLHIYGSFTVLDSTCSPTSCRHR